MNPKQLLGLGFGIGIIKVLLQFLMGLSLFILMWAITLKLFGAI